MFNFFFYKILKKEKSIHKKEKKKKSKNRTQRKGKVIVTKQKKIIIIKKKNRETHTFSLFDGWRKAQLFGVSKIINSAPKPKSEGPENLIKGLCVCVFRVRKQRVWFCLMADSSKEELVQLIKRFGTYLTVKISNHLPISLQRLVCSYPISCFSFIFRFKKKKKMFWMLILGLGFFSDDEIMGLIAFYAYTIWSIRCWLRVCET